MITNQAADRAEARGGVIAQTPSRTQRIRTRLMRYGFPVALPIISAVTTAIAAVNHGADRVYWSIAAFVAIGLAAAINVFKERSSTAIRENAERTKAELATALADIGLPLIVALGNVTSAPSLREAIATIDVLLDRSVNLAQTQLGKQCEPQCGVRAAYYSFDGKDKLVRKKYHTWAGAKVPRPHFIKRHSRHEEDVVTFAQGEDVRFYRNLDKEAPPYFSDAGTRSYKTFIAVPVRAGDNSFGLLTADSDIAYGLTNADRGFLILVAGTLAAGLAHVETIKTRDNASKNS